MLNCHNQDYGYTYRKSMIFNLPLYRDSIQLCYLLLFFPNKKRLQQAMVAQIDNVRTAANMLNIFLNAIISTLFRIRHRPKQKTWQPIYFYSYKEMKPESNKKISMDSNFSALSGAQHILSKIYPSPTHKVVNFYLFIIIKKKKKNHKVVNIIWEL